MTDTTVIRNIDWLVAWDEVGPGGGHRYLKNADLAFLEAAGRTAAISRGA